MEDGQSKYQKLASEYSKLKAQIPVLKKAFLDEQDEKNKLKDVIKEKDQSLRKFELEIDSLTFRNQQLSKRVLLLQEEFEASTHTKKKNKSSKVSDGTNQDSAGMETGVFNEELLNKIEENARLHKQVNESSTIYEQKVHELEESLRTVELEHSQYNEVLNATKQQSKTQIEKLMEEKVVLESRLAKLDTDVKQFKMRAEVAEIKLKSVQADLSNRLEFAQNIVNQKLPFVDTIHKEVNELNLPVYDRKYILLSTELVNQAKMYISEFIQGFSNFYTYCEQRSKIYPVDGMSETLSANTLNYCKLLHNNLTYLRPIEQSFKTFNEKLKADSSLSNIENCKELKLFCEKFSDFVKYNNNLLPLQLLSIEEECAISSCPSMLSAKNMELHKSLSRLNKTLNELNNVMGLLVDKSGGKDEKSGVKLFEGLAQFTGELKETFKEVSKIFNSKVSLEHQLPTATQKLKTTDECIVSSLISLVTSSGKIASFMSNNLEFFRANSTKLNSNQTVSSAGALVGNFRSKAAAYVNKTNKPLPESVPYNTALFNRKILISSAENKEGLAKQIEKFQKSLTVLEQEKEHYLLELQLLQIKYENEFQKNKQDAVVVNGKDVQVREPLIKNHFNSRLNQQTLQLQLIDSKCVNFYAEVRALHKQLQLSDYQKTTAEEELSAAQKYIAQLKDEHQMTTQSYESQLNMMSEHLAGMNEKLALQKDEIDEQRLLLQGKTKTPALKKKK